MDAPAPRRTPIDRQQAEAVADALLAEGRARQRERLLRRWRARQCRRGQLRAAATAGAVVLALWAAGRGAGVPVHRPWLVVAGVLAYALALRCFRPRAWARGVIES